MSNSGMSSIRYVPNTTNISYVQDKKLYVLDRSTGTSIILLDSVYEGNVGGYYDWDKTGEKLVYNESYDKIYIYDLKTKKGMQILEGRNPVYSNNSQYIAYWGTDNKLTVHDVNTKEEWKSVSLYGVQAYVFSPDDEYIALATQYSGITNIPYFKMYVVNYKTGIKTKLFKGDGNIPAFDWK